jgi:hypothetical protein
MIGLAWYVNPSRSRETAVPGSDSENPGLGDEVLTF